MLLFTFFLLTFVTQLITTMNTRLKQFLAAENITQAQFADNIKVVRASVSHVLSGRNNPSYDFIKAIMLHYPRLNIEWLIFGKGKMYKGAQEQETPLFLNESVESESKIAEFTDFSENPAVPEPVQNPLSAAQQTPQVQYKDKKAIKVIIMYDDGTYQEM